MQIHFLSVMTDVSGHIQAGQKQQVSVILRTLSNFCHSLDKEKKEEEGEKEKEKNGGRGGREKETKRKRRGKKRRGKRRWKSKRKRKDKSQETEESCVLYTLSHVPPALQCSFSFKMCLIKSLLGV